VILTDKELRRLGPELLDPYEVKNVQPASIDLRLGQSFRVFKRHSRASIDLAAVPDQDSITEEIIVPWYRNPDGTPGDERGGMVVHPGEMILGSTLECITVPGYLANKPGPASCGLCHPPAAPLVERGMVEFADGRPTPEPDPPTPNEPGVILRCTGLERIAPPVPTSAPKLVVPTPSEAKGLSTPEQAVSGPVGPQRHNPPRGPAKTAASARKTKKSPPPPPAPSLF
jgi:hypothetical protein